MVLYPPTMYYCEKNAERIELQFVGEHAEITSVSEVEGEKHEPLDLPYLGCGWVGFLKPTAFSIKIESPWSQNVTTYDMKYQL